MIRYTLSATAAIRPTMLSALKTLDPLDDQGEDGEGRDGQHDVEDVGHLGLLVTRNSGRLRDGALGRSGSTFRRTRHGTPPACRYGEHIRSSNGR